jgi:phosphatidate phosphatase APP1
MAGLNKKQKPYLKVYRGYGHTGSLVVCGHLFKQKPRIPGHSRRGLFPNFIHLLQLFFVKPLAGAAVQLHFYGQTVSAITRFDGFFRFEWQSAQELPAGWHNLAVSYSDESGKIVAKGRGEVFVPHVTQYAFISDIDDTILKSYSATILRRLFELLVRPPSGRRIFLEAAAHYRLLSRVHTEGDNVLNPMFYVSSSEWNLYEYLGTVFRSNHLPDGAFVLNRIKRWYQLLVTGKNGHENKLTHIAHILDTFPRQRFVLIGDNSQKDPDIYQAIASRYPGQVYAVYIRNVRDSRTAYTQSVLKSLEAKGIYTCLFVQNAEAVRHGRAIGLIDRY